MERFVCMLGPADLIRQLNLARAQGLVVLQQWGDKQVQVQVPVPYLVTNTGGKVDAYCTVLSRYGTGGVKI